MTLHRFAAKRDENEQAIIIVLEAHGFAVCRVSGRGFPDLVVTKRGRVWFVEVKRPKGRFTPAQVEWRAKWTGPAPVTLRSVDEAIVWVRTGDRKEAA